MVTSSVLHRPGLQSFSIEEWSQATKLIEEIESSFENLTDYQLKQKIRLLGILLKAQ